MDRDERRGRKPQVSDEEILAVFSEARDPVLIASEVAEHLSIGRRAVYDRLEKLETNEELVSKKVGGRATVWWSPGDTTTSPGEYDFDR